MGGEGDNKEWDGWMASPTQWRWVWINSGSWWGTGKPGVLCFMGLQRVGHDWVTELNWTLDIKLFIFVLRNKQAFCQYGNVKEDPSAVLSLSGDTRSQTSYRKNSFRNINGNRNYKMTDSHKFQCFGHGWLSLSSSALASTLTRESLIQCHKSQRA